MSGKNFNRVLIVEERNNPSTDYFVLPHFSPLDYEVVKFNFNDLPTLVSLKESIVVFVRYVPKQWRQLLSQHKALFKELYFFMDDDLFDLNAAKGQPLKYRWKLFKLSYRHQSWLKKQHAKILVSNKYLAKKYDAYNPEVIQPQPLAFQKERIRVLLEQENATKNITNETGSEVRIFYHGSASHQAEIDWLYPIVKQVLKLCPNACFELIGTKKMAKLFLGLDRVNIVHPMDWPSYQAFIQQPGRHIGLAPVLNTPFNNARSYTKFFDITTAGAIGVYAKHSTLGHYVEESLPKKPMGLVFPMEQDVWVTELIELIQNPKLRYSSAENAMHYLLTENG